VWEASAPPRMTPRSDKRLPTAVAARDERSAVDSEGGEARVPRARRRRAMHGAGARVSDRRCTCESFRGAGGWGTVRSAIRLVRAHAATWDQRPPMYILGASSLHFGGLWGVPATARRLDVWSKCLASSGRSAENTLMKAPKSVKEMHNLKRKSRATCADPAHIPVCFDGV
jgi:hypothetical protein